MYVCMYIMCRTMPDMCKVYILGSPGSSEGKESACNTGNWVRSLGLEDPLEEGMASHASMVAWRIPREREEPGRPQSMGLQRVRHD